MHTSARSTGLVSRSYLLQSNQESSLNRRTGEARRESFEKITNHFTLSLEETFQGMGKDCSSNWIKIVEDKNMTSNSYLVPTKLITWPSSSCVRYLDNLLCVLWFSLLHLCVEWVVSCYPGSLLGIDLGSYPHNVWHNSQSLTQLVSLHFFH